MHCISIPPTFHYPIVWLSNSTAPPPPPFSSQQPLLSYTTTLPYLTHNTIATCNTKSMVTHMYMYSTQLQSGRGMCAACVCVCVCMCVYMCVCMCVCVLWKSCCLNFKLAWLISAWCSVYTYTFANVHMYI